MEILSLFTNEINQNGYNFNLLTKNKIGFLYIAPVNIVPEDCLACDGYVLKIEDYKKLYAVIGTTFNTGEEAADEFRIPDYNITKRFLQPGINAGQIIEAGLPNISGITGADAINNSKGSGRGTPTGPFYYNGNSGYSVATSGGTPSIKVEMDLSKANSIYGASKTVQPPTQIVHICIKYI